MRSRRLVGGLAGLAVAIGGPLLATAAPANAGSVTSPSFSSGPESVVSKKGSDGRTNVVEPEGASIPRPKSVPEDAKPAEVAKAHLDTYAKSFGVKADDMKLKSSAKLAGGNAVRFDQEIDGRQVLGGQIVTSLDRNGGLEFAVGETAPKEGLSFPKVNGDADAAAKQAVQVHEKLKDDKGLKVERVGDNDGQIWFSGQIVGRDAESGVDPAVNLRVTKSGTSLAYQVIVNAETGRVEVAANEHREAIDRTICDGDGAEVDSSDPDSFACGTAFEPTRTEGEGDTGQADADKVYKWLGDTSKRYASYVNLDITKLIGTNDAGENSGDQSLRALVNVCDPTQSCPEWSNAFWNGHQGTFGSAVMGDDVVAHEYTHGVNEHTAGFLYYYQAGALDEGFADVWGELVDQHNGDDDDTPENAWQIGEGTDGGVIRSMSDPTEFGDPDTLTSENWAAEQAGEQTWDNGGVHTNSGVLNKWAYLLGQPEEPTTSFNGYDVRSIGPAKLAKVAFSMQNLLTSGADYKDVYSISQLACKKNIDAPGSYITADDCAQVEAAAKATEMQKDPSGNSPVNVPYCDDGTQKTYAEEQFDGEDAPWQPEGNANLMTGYATTGDQSLGFQGSGAATQMEPVEIKEGSSLRIDTALIAGSQDFGEASLQYSTDGGSSWEDASTLDNKNGGPWNEDTYGWASARYDLSSLAGEQVQLRFNYEASDSTWALDNVRFYTCG